MRKHSPHSMKWKIVMILLVCWLVPFSFLIGVTGFYLGTNYSDMTEANYQSQLEFNNRICMERLDRTIVDSRQASYDGEILDIWKEYQSGRISHILAKKRSNEYLRKTYQQNDAISCVLLWMENEEERLTSSMYNTKSNGTYQGISSFWRKNYEAVRTFAQTLDTSVGFLVRGEELFLVRNLKDSSYVTQGVLVFSLNKSYCFDSIENYPMQDEACVWIDGQKLMMKDAENTERWEKMYSETELGGSQWTDGRLRVAASIDGKKYQLRSIMLINKTVTRFPFYGYEYVMGGMVLFLIPLLAVVLSVFRKEVTDPVEQLIEVAKQIEKGEFGCQVEESSRSLEFCYLTAAFNQMSEHLKQQFDKIYQEEIALREARIMALQSHINPHFMNNTMEIINWEARLAGNVKVSRMIEALSNMMDAAMDRRKRPEVQLAEEMGYVNSYLYIMKERLGKRLTVEIEMPDELLQCPVPRLVLQPMIENAIEHGVVPNGSGTVLIRGWQDGKYLYLDTINDGGLSEEDYKRVDRLLDINYNTSKEPAGNMGIANVNQRLRILFGEPCGLTIWEYDGHVTARLTIPLRNFGQKREQ